MRRESHNTSEYIRMMLRNRSGRLFVPVIVAYVILTVVCFYYRREAVRYPEFFKYVTEWCHRIVPMFACWWVLILYNEFVSGEGNELLYLYLSPQAVLKVQFAAVMAYFVWIGIYIGGMQFFFEMKPFFVLRLCTESFFISGAAYLLVSLVRNTGVPILLIFIYCAYLDQRLSVCTEYLGGLSSSLQSQQWSVKNVNWAAGTFVVTVFLYLTGYAVYRKIRKYE